MEKSVFSSRRCLSSDRDLNYPEGFEFSIFDYDVSVAIIKESPYHSIGCYHNLPTLLRDSRIALENGRSIICLPQSKDFYSTSGLDRGMSAYKWIRQLGIELQDNAGSDIKASGAGKAQVIQEYLTCASRYHQIVVHPDIPLASRLAVVDDTDIVIGIEQQVGKGVLVILPPPILNDDTYLSAMSNLIDVARRYYERAQRIIYTGDTPDWVQQYLVPRVEELDKQRATPTATVTRTPTVTPTPTATTTASVEFNVYLPVIQVQ